jgi:putative tricarboxylic transport membrane protein
VVTTNRLGRLLAAAAIAPVLVMGAGCAKKDDAGSGTATVKYPTKTLSVMAPAAAGGGWDLTARNLQKAIKDGNLAGEAVEVYNVPGAAGTVGLAELVAKRRGDAHQLMVTGLVMVGGVVTNKSAVDLTQTTPIATLTAEPEVVVVPASSKYTTLKELLDAWKANPASVKFGGGSAGGTDHILVGLLAKAAGIDPKAMKYVAYSGGGEAKAALLSGDLSAGVSGPSEFADLIAGGKVRVLANSGSAAITVGGASASTIKTAGYDVELMNWRGIVAPPGISAAERKAITEFVDKVHGSEQWKGVLAQQKWEDFYRSGDAAEAFFKSETSRIKSVLVEAGVAGS